MLKVPKSTLYIVHRTVSHCCPKYYH